MKFLQYSLILSFFSLISCQKESPTVGLGYIDFVDPLIGTGISTTETAVRHSHAGNEAKAQTFPVVGVPFGMTNWTPQTHATEQKCFSPYYYFEDSIQGFRGSHWMSGSCTQDYGSVTIMPLTGELKSRPSLRASSFSHEKEVSTPAYYSVLLEDYGIQVEMTGLSSSAIFKLDYQKEKEGYLIIEPNSDEGEAFINIDRDKKEISGYNPVHRIYQGWGEPAGFSGYFVIQFENDFGEYGTWADSIKHSFNPQISGKGLSAGAYVKLTQSKEPIKLKIGTSFSSIEQARKNLLEEIPTWDFDQVRELSELAWEKELEKIDFKGSKEEKTIFYTALYHSMILPRTFSDVDGTHPSFAGGDTLLKNDYNYYADFSMWDTYRAVHPLVNLLHPERAEDMMASLVEKAETGGWLPIFPSWNQYTAAMIGDHVTATLADAYLKGISGFDTEKAFKYMWKNATEPNKDIESYKAGKGRRALDSYMENNFLPLEDQVLDAFHKREQASRTLEYAYDDFALGMLAKKLGKEEEANIMFERAMNYRNVIDTTTGFLRGRYKNGRWIEDFDPFAKRASFITEGSPFQYTWYVPHDMAGLIKQMGGMEETQKKLDLFFNEGHYWHGNEPNHQIPYLYVYAGQAWKSQELIPRIIKEEYTTGAGGISGNDDAGQMSAWLVFSMIGFYPVCPSMPVYIMGIPSSEEIQINLENGNNFKILAEGLKEGKAYIQSATLNGQDLERAWLKHEEIMAGGELILILGEEPNKNWGAKEEFLPPSLSTGLDF